MSSDFIIESLLRNPYFYDELNSTTTTTTTNGGGSFEDFKLFDYLKDICFAQMDEKEEHGVLLYFESLMKVQVYLHFNGHFDFAGQVVNEIDNVLCEWKVGMEIKVRLFKVLMEHVKLCDWALGCYFSKNVNAFSMSSTLLQVCMLKNRKGLNGIKVEDLLELISIEYDEIYVFYLLDKMSQRDIKTFFETLSLSANCENLKRKLCDSLMNRILYGEEHLRNENILVALCGLPIPENQLVHEVLLKHSVNIGPFANVDVVYPTFCGENKKILLEEVDVLFALNDTNSRAEQLLFVLLLSESMTAEEILLVCERWILGNRSFSNFNLLGVLVTHCCSLALNKLVSSLFEQVLLPFFVCGREKIINFDSGDLQLDSTNIQHVDAWKCLLYNFGTKENLTGKIMDLLSYLDFNHSYKCLEGVDIFLPLAEFYYQTSQITKLIECFYSNPHHVEKVASKPHILQSCIQNLVFQKNHQHSTMEHESTLKLYIELFQYCNKKFEKNEKYDWLFALDKPYLHCACGYCARASEMESTFLLEFCKSLNSVQPIQELEQAIQSYINKTPSCNHELNVFTPFGYFAYRVEKHLKNNHSFGILVNLIFLSFTLQHEHETKAFTKIFIVCLRKTTVLACNSTFNSRIIDVVHKIHGKEVESNKLYKNVLKKGNNLTIKPAVICIYLHFVHNYNNQSSIQDVKRAIISCLYDCFLKSTNGIDSFPVEAISLGQLCMACSNTFDENDDEMKLEIVSKLQKRINERQKYYGDNFRKQILSNC